MWSTMLTTFDQFVYFIDNLNYRSNKIKNATKDYMIGTKKINNANVKKIMLYNLMF